MSTVLTTGATALCGHPTGVVTLPATASKLTVGGKAVLLEAHVSGATVVGCALAGTGNAPCGTVTSVTDGKAVKLSVGGLPVLLDSLTGTTDGKAAGTTPQLLLAASDASSVLRTT
jgi:hypothetical protein